MHEATTTRAMHNAIKAGRKHRSIAFTQAWSWLFHSVSR